MFSHTPEEVRDHIRHKTRDGQALEAIERELIEPAPLSEDAKSGLWLYAWSRREVTRRGRFRRSERGVARLP